MSDVEFSGVPADELNKILVGKIISKISEDSFVCDRTLVIEFNDGTIVRMRYDFVFETKIMMSDSQ